MKKTIIALVAVVVILGVVGVGGYFAFKFASLSISNKLQETVGSNNRSSNNEIENEDNSTEDSISTEDCIRACKQTFASNSDFDCDGYCNASEGIDNNDPLACEKATDSLKDACYVQIASNTKNPEICDKIEDKTIRYGCYINIVEETKDKSVCEKIEDESLKAACNAIE